MELGECHEDKGSLKNAIMSPGQHGPYPPHTTPEHVVLWEPRYQSHHPDKSDVSMVCGWFLVIHLSTKRNDEKYGGGMHWRNEGE